MRELQKKEIGGIQYECLQFEVRKSLRVLTRIGRKLGKPLAALMSKAGSVKALMEMDVNTNGLADAVDGLLSDLGDEELYELARDICSDVIAKQAPSVPGGKLGDDGKFDLHFKGQGGLIRLIQVSKWALEVNFGDFIGAVTELLGSNVQEVSAPGTSTRVR